MKRRRAERVVMIAEGQQTEAGVMDRAGVMTVYRDLVTRKSIPFTDGDEELGHVGEFALHKDARWFVTGQVSWK